MFKKLAPIFFTIATLWLSLSSFSLAYAIEEGIPLKDIRLPSNDLVGPYGELIDAEQAWELKKEQGLDLSKLDPMASELWSPSTQTNAAADSLNINSGSSFKFRGALSSQSGLFRFNAESLEQNSRAPFIVHLDKTLHMTLLRKNLLRKLGYKIPALQYVKEIKLSFESLEEKKQFLTRQLPENTFGTPKRWVTEGLEDESLSITLQDVALTSPSEKDHYNLALGVPPTTQISRTLRSLIIPYALSEVGESINKTTWTLGRIDNDEIRLRHFALSNLNATMDDARWMARRLEKLSEQDIKEIVEMAYFPKAVEILLIEKMKSRRNSLLSLLEVEHTELKVNQKPAYQELLVDGALTQEEWDGHAARYAHGTPDSPFQDAGYFAFAEFQSAVINSLISQANQHLSVFDLNEARMEHLTEQFVEGLDHFVETGEFLEQGVSTWFSPTLDGQLILSRDIIIGNYLGTTNLVQLADTVGYSVRLGGHLGIEGLERFTSASLSASLSYLKTFSHLKPVKTLKESVKEPYKNIVVPLLKRSLQNDAQRLADYIRDNPQDPNATDDEQGEQRQEDLSNIMTDLNKSLGVGESIIVTERITPSIGASARMVIIDGGLSSIGADLAGLLIKRLHFFRKDAKTLQVYVDNGLSATLTLSFSFDKYIPIIKFQNKVAKGKYDLKIYGLDLNIDEEENPKLQASAAALSYLLKTNSTELLDEVAPASTVKNHFQDQTSKFSFLHWRSRHIKQNNLFTVKTPTSSESQYVKVTNGLQSGLNYRAFLTDILNYYIGQYTKDIQLSSEFWRNPGQTFLGTSETSKGKFEARARDESSMDHWFVSLTEKREGWSISEKRLKKEIQKVNERYGRVLFPESTVADATALQLFTISTKLNIYQEGLEELLFSSQDKLKNLQRIYRRVSAFDMRCNPSRNRLLSRNSIECGNFSLVFDKQEDCLDYYEEKKNHKLGQCLIDLTQTLVKNLKFDDVVELIGEDNLYLDGQINGFRKESEILISPIQAHSFGKISSRFQNGPVEAVRTIMGAEMGEFNGSWMRENF